MPETTDPTFYRSPGEAIAAPAERLAYVAAFDPVGRANDAMTVVDCDPGSASYGQVVGWSELPTAGNELHHFGWNACSSALCHPGHGDHGTPLERRYLIVPGIRSSRTYVLDTKPDPRSPTVVRTIEAEELAAKAGYSRPHTVHCGPGAIFLSALGGANGNDGPGGVALLDHDLRRRRCLGAGPRGAVLRLRRVVASGLRHRDHLRVGNPLDGRARPQPRGSARAPVRPPI
jgi:methanethiol oxidase